MPVELKIGHVPWRYATGRIEVPGVRLVDGQPWELRASGHRWQLAHVRPEDGPRDPKQFADFAADARDSDRVPFVVGPYLRNNTRRALEDRGISYMDFFGNVHIDVPPIYVHVQTPAQAELTRTVGLAGMRAAQTMLLEPSRSWSVTDLAAEARVSVGQAHSVARILESADLVYTEGRGPERRRHIREPGRFIDWLADQKAGRTARASVNCSKYSRTPDALWTTVARQLGTVDYAVSGAAAASLLGVSATAVPRTLIRVDAHIPLRHIASMMDAEITDRAPNIMLLSDTGALGTTKSTVVAQTKVAPAVRVYLDLFSEIRGADLASDFRERILGY